MIKRLFILILILNCQVTWAALRIEVTQGVERAIPLVVLPFTMTGQGNPPENIAEIVYADLQRSGEFRLSPPLSYAQANLPEHADNYAYWKAEGMDYLVTGEIRPIGFQQYQVNYKVIDILKASVAKALDSVEQKPAKAADSAVTYNGQVTIKPGQWRNAAHHIADQVYLALTGVPGIANTRIAYVTLQWLSNGKRTYRLEVADADGYNPKALLTSPEPIMSPAWSPDGRKLAYVSFENHRAEIYISDLETGSRQRLSQAPGINGAPAWSPDGKQLALVLSKEQVPKIYSMSLASGTLKQLTHGNAIDTEPNWSPDGKSLVFTSNRGGSTQIYQLNLGDQSVKRLTYSGQYNARGRVTPDGKRLVFIHRQNNAYHIAVQDLMTNQLNILTQTKMDESPSVSPNGRLVIYGTHDGQQRELSAVSIDGRVKLRIPTSSGDVQEPAWSPLT